MDNKAMPLGLGMENILIKKDNIDNGDNIDSEDSIDTKITYVIFNFS
jgi:hypothetical protein